MEVATHKCFIQPVNHKYDDPRKKKKRNAQTRRVVHSNQGEELEDEFKPTPLFVFADYEPVTDTDGVQTPIMVCAEDAETDETKVLYGNVCEKASEVLGWPDSERGRRGTGRRRGVPQFQGIRRDVHLTGIF